MDKFLSHLAEKRAKLQKQLQKVEHDLADLDKAERLYRESGAAAATQPSEPPEPSWTAHVPDSLDFKPTGGGLLIPFMMQELAAGTIKQRVVRLLEGNPKGLTSGQILEILQTNGMPDLARESLSPQLSRLKTDAANPIVLSNGVWKLKKHEPQGM